MTGLSERRRRRLNVPRGVHCTVDGLLLAPVRAADQPGVGDWDQHLFYYAALKEQCRFGQMPFWNPWYCGGNVLWQNPQIALLSPVYPLTRC